MTRLTSLLVFVVATVAAVPAALACGGFFCNAVQPVLTPVEQNAERILFEMNGDGTVTAIVEISYSGNPSDFSWVVPVSDTPELAVVPASTLLVLDDATAPTIQQQPTVCTERGYGCDVGGVGAAGVGFGCASSALRAGDFGAEDFGGGVLVEELEQVGPYLSEVVSSDDPAALINWLNKNGYLITPEMEEFVSDYVTQGIKFLAMKLAPGAATTDIEPISMTYPGDSPSIPLVLTSVSAEPEMGVMVFIASNERYQSSNWPNVLVDPVDVRADPSTSQTNYYPLLSWLVDQVGGNAMVTEYAGDIGTPVNNGINTWSFQFQEEADWLAGLRGRHSYLTRMYTRVSGWEMTSDPIFEPSPGGTVSNFLDLTENDPIEICANDPTPLCGRTYCGEGATCATTEFGDEGCACPEGTVARSIQSPELNGLGLYETVTCQRLDFDLMGSVDSLGPGANSDPCMNTDCGAGGSCIALNGFPTCDCADGGVAVPDGQGGLRCEEAIDLFGPEDGLLASAVAESTEVAFKAATPNGRSAALVVAVLLIPMLIVRRPNRRAA
ncbi:MAG: DUF2330 domain-containing protein [Proteobacteria bacterium]|nr:DUF2330 domain-containing protein [Pseudomonadota bacterium]